jgi:hypothetical protein
MLCVIDISTLNKTYLIWFAIGAIFRRYAPEYNSQNKKDKRTNNNLQKTTQKTNHRHISLYPN